MTIKRWILDSTLLLSPYSATARLDCEVLLAHVLDKDRVWLLAHPEHVLQGQSLKRVDRYLQRRKSQEPIAYIIGHSEFYGREFEVSADTLQPRPETETMVELLLDTINSKQLSVNSIVDVGTGSGAIIISAFLELSINHKLSTINFHATDISPAALEIARQNAKRYDADIKFYQGDLLGPLLSTIYHLPSAIILANLPYVPDSHTINQAAMHEPKHAIFGGTDGLDLYRTMFDQLSTINYQLSTILFTESLPPQHKELARIAEQAGFKQIAEQDFIQVFEKK
ncbi:peptide chain release factor N(5)-glutamine methyltransferase [Candidatus Saccharibacteria bacterium]|jgi:release factor glutamine methyltransferase|nr:MAG: peptide chain release factor N(5)-glutamine methyltransferase [Candidatus Saccharibacteria bacterium]